MTRLLTIVLMLLVLLSAGANAQSYFAVASNLVEDGGDLPRSAASDAPGCNGENMSPQLSWSGAPAATRSFAVSVYDPEGNNGAGTLHWAVLNLPADTYTLAADMGTTKNRVLPGIANSIPNSEGVKGYTGPCPPKGATHRYEFTVYAMPYKQAFYPLSAVGRSTVTWLRERALAKATMTVKYTR